jgi:hypothetical protein
MWMRGDSIDTALQYVCQVHPDIPTAVATAALQVAQGDPRAAAFIVQQSRTKAPTPTPVCRHFVSDRGCYRKDCPFVHENPDAQPMVTCRFWVMGSCGQGDQCRFAHGFLPHQLDAYHHVMQACRQQQQQQFISQQPIVEPTTHGEYASAPSASHASTSFARVAVQGYQPTAAFVNPSSLSPSTKLSTVPLSRLPRIPIPDDVWHAHENRNAVHFFVPDPLERFTAVSSVVRRPDVIDLHYQSIQTFADVLLHVLEDRLQLHEQVWIVTGTGHHVGKRTHQKGGGVLEQAVATWLQEQAESDNASLPKYTVWRGKDNNGEGGALLVRFRRS